MSAASQSPAAPSPKAIGAEAIPALLIALAALGWWWTLRMTRMDMSMAALSFLAFLVAWVAMMAAMMFPAVAPVVRLYARAAAKGHVAPLPVFVAGYLVVWSAIGVPAFFAWRALLMPLTSGAPWAARLAGAVLVGAAIYQLTPLKSVCLRHCRTPLSFFMHHGKNLESPRGAAVAGLWHGAFCLGCCWALMAVLIAVGTMQLWWMAGLALLIFVEKNLRWGEVTARAAAAVLAAAGVLLLAYPALIGRIT